MDGLRVRRAETSALGAALALGGHARVGFENNPRRADGSSAADNAERVAEIAALRRALHRPAPQGGGLGVIGVG